MRAFQTSRAEITPPPATREVSGEIGGKPKTPPLGMPPLERSGEIIAKPAHSSTNSEQSASSSGEIRSKTPGELPAPRRAAPMEVQTEDVTHPTVTPTTPVPGAMRVIPIVAMASVGTATSDTEDESNARGSIMGIGIGMASHAAQAGAVSGEIPTKVKPGARVLVPGPNGLMQSATVRQLLQGYYELEVGSSGETIWVPINGVIPEN